MDSLSPLLCSCLLADSSILSFLFDHSVPLPKTTLADIPSPLFYALLAPTSAPLLTLASHGSPLSSFSLAGLSLKTFGARHRTLLHVLCTQNPTRHFEDVAWQLLIKGLDIDARDEDGNTPLHLAVLYANPAFIRFLVTHGASLSIQNAAGKTPSQLATELNIREAIDALQACTLPPLPPAAPQVFLCPSNRLVARWERPISREGVPEVTLYEAEATDLGSGEWKGLGNQFSGEGRRGRRAETKRWRWRIRSVSWCVCGFEREIAMDGASGRIEGMC